MDNSNSSLVKRFTELYKKVESMDTHYIRSNLQTYTDACNKLNSLAANIIKDDLCEYVLDNDTFTFTIDMVHYYINLDDVTEYLDIREIQRIMGKQREAEKEEERKKRREEHKQAHQQNNMNMQNPMFSQNPFATAMASYFMAPFFGAGQESAFPQLPMNELAENLDDLKDEISEQRKTTDTLVRKVTRLTNMLENKSDFSVDIETPSDNEDIRRLQEQVTELSERLEDERNKNAELSKSKPERVIPGSSEEMSKRIVDLEAELARARDLAFLDNKYGVKNANAYLDFISNCDKDTITIAVCGIHNTKQINQVYGRSRGDNVIKLVAKKLSEMYGNDNVYRVYGDQFFLLLMDTDSSKIKDELGELQADLFKELISISYGVIDGVTCDSIELAVLQAEGEMNGMKIKNGGQKIIQSELQKIGGSKKKHKHNRRAGDDASVINNQAQNIPDEAPSVSAEEPVVSSAVSESVKDDAEKVNNAVDTDVNAVGNNNTSSIDEPPVSEDVVSEDEKEPTPSAETESAKDDEVEHIGLDEVDILSQTQLQDFNIEATEADVITPDAPSDNSDEDEDFDVIFEALMEA